MTTPTVFETISDQPEATEVSGLFVAAESQDPNEPTNKVSLSHLLDKSSEVFNYDGLIYKGVGNISDFAGQQLQEDDKTNAYQHPDNSRKFYAADKSQAFPITIPADPSASDEWALVNAINSDSLSLYTDRVFKASGGKSAVENMIDSIGNLKLGDKTSCQYGSEFVVISGAGGISDFKPVKVFSQDYIKILTADSTQAHNDATQHANDFGVGKVTGFACYINGTVNIPEYIHLDFGYSRINAGSGCEFNPDQGSSLTALRIDMGDDYLTVPNRSVCYLDGKKRFFLQDGLKTEIKLAVFSRVYSGDCVLFDAVSGGAGGASIVGVDLELTVNQFDKAVSMKASSAAGGISYINSNRIKLRSSASRFGIDEDIITTQGTEIAENYYDIEYQTTSGGYAVPLNLEGDRTVVNGQIWDLQIASNMSNVRVSGDFNTIIGSGFPTEESGRLAYTGLGLNQIGGSGGTPRSRAYSHIAERTHCKYIGLGRGTNDLINATYAFLVSGNDAIISGTDYSDGTVINSKTFTPDQFILNGDISVDYKMIGKPSSGDKFGLGIRINGTTYSTLRASGLVSDGFIAQLTLYMSTADNRIDIAYKIGGKEKVLVSESVPDLSVNGASIEVYGFSHEGSEPSNRVTIAGLDGLIKYKTA